MDRNLDAFLAVARAENLTQASERLNLTQPSVTKRIANLEAELGSALFERHRRGMTLTPAGKLFYARAKRIESEYNQAREEVAAISAAGLSVLRVGAGPLYHLNYVAGLFKTLKLQFPNLRLELITDSTSRALPMLVEQKLDVYLGRMDSEIFGDELCFKYVTSVEHGIVLAPDDPNARMEKVDPALLSDYSWIIYTDDSEMERKIQGYYLPKEAISPTVDVRTTSFAAGLQLVSQGNFVMSAPLQLARVIEKEGLKIRPSLNGMPKRKTGIHLRKSSLQYPVIQSLLRFFNEVRPGVQR